MKRLAGNRILVTGAASGIGQATALRLLAGGAKVTQAALDAGYSTPSAFIAMFRRTLGCTPRAYFHGTAGL